MAKFQFRLAKLQHVREIHRDELRGKLAEAIQAQQILDRQAGEVQAEIEQLESARRAAFDRPQTDVNDLLAAQRYQAILLAQLTNLRQQAHVLAVEVERRRLAVVEADQQVKVLEKLHERQLKNHLAEKERQEIKIFDEVAARFGKEGDPWQH